MKNKAISVQRAVEMIPDGASLMIGGFLGGITAAIGLAISEAALPKDYLTTSADDLMMIGGILGWGVGLALLVSRLEM